MVTAAQEASKVLADRILEQCPFHPDLPVHKMAREHCGGVLDLPLYLCRVRLRCGLEPSFGRAKRRCR
jgi:hypothetical protein